ncbi:MAG: VOC family protein [Thermomicrobiales bacterium]
MEPIYTILYVADMERSVPLYTELLGITPDRPAPTFTSFALSGGKFLELIQQNTLDVLPTVGGGAVELCFDATSREVVEQTHDRWVALGLTSLEAPTDVRFGYTALVADPDGHRLRILLLPQR